MSMKSKLSSEYLESLKNPLTSELKQLSANGNIVINWMCSSNIYRPFGYLSVTQLTTRSRTKQMMKVVHMLIAIHLLNDDKL